MTQRDLDGLMSVISGEPAEDVSDLDLMVGICARKTDADAPLIREDDDPGLAEALGDIDYGLNPEFASVPARIRYSRLAWGIQCLIERPEWIRQLAREEAHRDTTGSLPSHRDEILPET